jgi:uncharacterized protein (DUF488 family)
MSAAPTFSILTIGHSNHSIERFAELLTMHGVTAVADVRSAPYSRMNPQFNREVLQQELKRRKIAYVFLGRELGARSEDPSCYEGGRVQYRRLAQTELFRTGLERITKGAQSNRIALLCAEREPLSCHRTLLVARELEKLGATVGHILADGSVESNSAAMDRLLIMFHMQQPDMLCSREDLVEEACARQEQRIAYVDEDMRVADGGGGELSGGS